MTLRSFYLWEHRWGLGRVRDSQIRLTMEVVNPPSLKTPDNYQSGIARAKGPILNTRLDKRSSQPITTPGFCTSGRIYRWVSAPGLGDLCKLGRWVLSG